MAIIEIHGGPINHRYLMKKSKDELASMYMRLLRYTEQDAKDAERYRWLRAIDDNAPLDASGYPSLTQWKHVVSDRAGRLLFGKELDAAIDAAMNGANDQVQP